MITRAGPLGARRSAVQRAPLLAPAVEILVCGSVDRGDDGAPMLAAQRLSGALPADVRLVVIGQLDVDDLLALPAGTAVVIVDAAVGLAPGEVVDLELNALVGRHDGGVRPRSSHALAFPEVLGLAEFMRGPLRGRIVAIGASRFGLGRPVSRIVRAGLPALTAAILAAVERLRVER